MTYQFRAAQRSQAKPLIGLYSESGAGKTYSALVLARGFVGPEGRIGMIETESGRGEAYADPAEYPEIGGYEVLPLRENFSPKDYGEAITAAEKAELDALIIDSASHEWEGAGGVLSLAAANQEAGKKGPIVWQQPKLLHQRHFMLRFMQTSIPLVILCMRAKYPMREVPDRNGKKQWIRSDQLDPKQADDILFEMFVHGWIDRDTHRFHMTKCTAKALEPVFNGDKPISLETGQALAKWAAGGAAPMSKAAGNGHARDPFDDAKAAAEQGVEAFRAWWAQQSKTVRAAVNNRRAELKTIAEAADAGADDVPDDPFADEDADTLAEDAATEGADLFNGEPQSAADKDEAEYLKNIASGLRATTTAESLATYRQQQESNMNLLSETGQAEAHAMFDVREGELG